MSDLQLFRHNQATRNEIRSALQHLDQAMPAFADMLDRLDELDVTYDAGAEFAQLMDEATSRLRKAGELLESTPKLVHSTSGKVSTQ